MAFSTGVSLLTAGAFPIVDMQRSLYAWFDFSNSVTANNNGSLLLTAYGNNATPSIGYTNLGGTSSIVSVSSITSSTNNVGFNVLKPIVAGQTLCGWLYSTAWPSTLFSRIRIGDNVNSGTVYTGNGVAQLGMTVTNGNFLFVALRIREDDFLATLNTSNFTINNDHNASDMYYTRGVGSSLTVGSYNNTRVICDSICVYDRHLTDQEISKLYNSGTRLTYSQLLSIPIEY